MVKKKKLEMFVIRVTKEEEKDSVVETIFEEKKYRNFQNYVRY